MKESAVEFASDEDTAHRPPPPLCRKEGVGFSYAADAASRRRCLEEDAPELPLAARRWRNGARSSVGGHAGALPGRDSVRRPAVRAISRLHLGCMSATSLLPLGYISATSRLPLGYLSAISDQAGFVRSEGSAPNQSIRRGLPLTVEAGTVAIIHYDLLHRGSAVAGPEAFAADTSTAAATDADAAAPAPPWRPMFKFQFVRVLEPLSPSSAVPPSSSAPPSASLSRRPPRVKGRRLGSNSSGRRMLLRRPQGSARDGWRAVLRPEEVPFGAAEEGDLSLLWDHVLQYLRGGKGGRGGASSQAAAETVAADSRSWNCSSTGPVTCPRHVP